jgi:PAS domain S-box-containing protein
VVLQNASIALAALLPRNLQISDGGTLGLCLVLGGLILVTLLLAVHLVSRRQHRRDLREIIETVEDLRKGRADRRAEIEPHSPYSILGDAVNRLAQDAASRWAGGDLADLGLRMLLDAAQEYAVVSTDTDGDVRSFSAAASTLFGWDEGALVGRPASALFEGMSWKEILPKLSRRSLRESGVETRALMVRRDGSSFPARVMIRQLKDPREEPVGFLLVAQDITPQAALELQLREAEARYTGLVEGLREGIAILREARILYANSALADLCGVPVRAMPGTLLRDRVATPDVLLVQERLRALEGRPAGYVERMSVTLVGPGGEPRAEVTLTATAILHENTPAVLAAVFDETSANRVEDEMRRNEARLDAILEAASDGVLVLADTAAGPIVRVANSAFFDLSGLRRDRGLGATQEDLLRSLRDGGEAGEAIAFFIASTASLPRHETMTLTAEAPRTLQLSLHPLTGGSGETEGRILACRDVTDQKEFERRLEANNARLRESKEELESSYSKLQEVHEDLARRSEELDRLNRELQTLDEMKSELLANVSHELQTPLVSIRGYTEMVLRGRLGAITEEQRKGLSLSLTNVDRLIAMIDNLLAFARMDRESAELRLTTFPLGPLVAESIEIVRGKLHERRISISTHLEDAEAGIRADREKILQVFLNLLANAIKFNREGGAIDVTTRRGKPGFVLVEIRDTGVGIPDSDLERIFDRFYRVAPADSQAEPGSGIGLSIVKNILRLHGCVIRATSRVGQGTTFSFSLPTTNGAMSAREEEARSMRQGDSPGGEAPPSTSDPVEEPDVSDPRPAGRPRFRIIRRPDPEEGVKT